MNKNVLYYQDNYMKEFEAKVLECTMEKDYYKIVLDNTAFYPEGGGQPADTGLINDIEVFDTQESKDIVYHYTKKEIEVGQKVKCKIDFEKRFINMQLHTAEHIVSGLICKAFDATNVGFRIGQDMVTLDFNKYVSKEDLIEIEKKANEAVYKDILLDIKFYNEDEVKDIDYRSKKDLKGTIRLVNIEGYDLCACCGVHVSKTSEIGMIKIIKSENYKGGVRVYMLAGQKALLDYASNVSIISELSQNLSLQPNELVNGINNLFSNIETLKKEKNELKTRLLNIDLEKLESKEYMTYENDLLDGDDFKTLIKKIPDEFSYKIFLVISNDKFLLLSKEVDLSDIIKNMRENKIIRGGGSSNLVQGQILTNKEDLINSLNIK